jgi:transcriptional regulator
MRKREGDKSGIEVLQGTLDMLILQTVRRGPRSGGIAQAIPSGSCEVLQPETGLLYPALHCLETQRWINSVWRSSECHQHARYYHLTEAGKKQLISEPGRWKQLSVAIVRLNPRVEGDDA